MKSIVFVVVLMAGCGRRPLDANDGCIVSGMVSDGLSSLTLSPECWERTMGAVSVANGIMQIDGRAAGYNFAELRTNGIGAGDFDLHARARVAGTPASSIALGWRGDDSDLAFLVPVGGDGRWHALIGHESITMKNASAVGSDYSELEIVRVNGAVEFLIEGAIVHSLVFSDDLSHSTVRVSATGAGAIELDAIELRYAP